MKTTPNRDIAIGVAAVVLVVVARGSGRWFADNAPPWVWLVAFLIAAWAVVRGLRGQQGTSPGSSSAHGRGGTLTPEERADAIEYCGFREPVDPAFLYMLGPAVVGAASLLGIGALGMVLASDPGQRVRALLIFLVGLPSCWLLGRFLARPVAPQNDDDLAREVRHRKQVAGDS